MPELYLTPSSISYLTQFILTFIITAYLFSRVIGRGKKLTLRLDGFLLVVFISLTLLSLLFFLEYSFLPDERLYAIFVENSVIALLLMALIQFAYDFPTPTGKYKFDRLLVSAFTFYYLYRELDVMIYRFQRLHQDGSVLFRAPDLNNMMAVGFVLLILIFARHAICNRPQPAIRNFALILLLPLGLAIIVPFRGVNPLITFWFPIASSIGLLFTIFFFILNYLTSQPQQVSFVIKISGAVLTSVLAVFGTIAWLVAQPYADRYVSPLQQLDKRTLHFHPDEKGGYIVSEIPFQWEDNSDTPPLVGEGSGLDEVEIDFPFSLFGQQYDHVYPSQFCAIGMESHNWSWYQYNLASTPIIMPLLVDLLLGDQSGSDFYLSQADGRLIYTCLNLSSSAVGSPRYTFQTVLFSDGSFNFTYNGLPPLRFHVDDYPGKTAWAVGVKPAAPTAVAVDFTNLPLRIEPQGAVHNEYRAFRIYLHEFLRPLAIAVVASSFVFLLGAALVLNYGLARPLRSLLQGVQNFDNGVRDVAIPIQSNDEIGYLTAAFNKVGGELNDLIQSLEQRVATRTHELATANAQLRAEMDARLAAQEQVVAQQRAVATLEERERLARDLHDGLGQVLGFLNVQSQSATDAVQSGDKEAALELLRRMVAVAQDAHDDVRGYILGLKKEPAAQPPPNFLTRLDHYCQHLKQNYGFQTRLHLPADLPPELTANQAIANQLFYVIREALSNARTHSGQKEAAVTITCDATHLRAVIADEGTGFVVRDGAAGQMGDHFGLSIMRERAAQVGGSLRIEATPGAGTRIIVDLPRQPATPAPANYRILLVDDHPLVLEGMSNLMVGRGATVVGVASNGLEAQEKARQLHPDVILMDIEMPRCDGLEATRRIKAEMPDVKIVMLTVSGAEQHLFEALQSGASGYLLKSLDAAELSTLLEELLRGEISLSPHLANKMLAAFTRHKSPPAQPPGVRPEKAPEPEPEPLTPRQIETLRLVAQGLSYKEVAQQLEVAEVTVKYRMGEILTRLHLNSKRDAVRYFREGNVNQ